MRRLCRSLVPLALVLTSANADAKTTPEEDKALEKRIVAAFNRQGPAIDRCTSRYLVEYPEAKGKVSLSMHVDKAGRVDRVTVETKLVGARNLRPCLERAAKGLRFPQTNDEAGGTLSLTLTVKKGRKFKLYAKGEAPPAPKDEPEEEGIFRFVNKDWVPPE